VKTKTKAKPQTEQRVDVVYLRKSTSAQRDAEQRANVELGLRELDVYIPARYWFSDTRSRNKPEDGANFQEMMKMVDEDKVGTIYVESQDRFGAGRGPKKLFAILSKLTDHRTKLIDLHTKNDLTSDEMAEEMQAYFGAKKSDTELLDTTRRSLRSKIGKMTKEGGWPGGPPPIGYDKAYYHESGRLLWVFHHTGHGRGNQLFPDDTGELRPGPQDIHPPRGNREITPRLYPDPTRRHIVEDVFRWWTTETISLRTIAHRLNNRGDKMYTGAWTHANVTTMLRNPAYTGTVSYGRTSRAELQQFDKTGKIEVVKEGAVVQKRRPLADCPQKENAHPALVDRKTWDAAQAKFVTGTRKAFAPREAEYFLKGLLYCGHCGKALTPSSDKKKSTGKVYRK
jgi:DNA invertase Pin-like site-specific DNA recombinase